MVLEAKGQPSGILEVICGPMFSGKSEELIRRLRRATIARQRVICFKHSLDNNRYNLDHITSHNGSSIAAYSIDREDQIIELADFYQAEVIGIDETQFFPRTIISIICSLIDAQRRIIIAGLDRDFRNMPFGPMPTLLAIADQVTKLTAICTACGTNAGLTQRLVDGKPAKYDDPVILVGAQESYQARCRRCFSIDKQPIEMYL